jgi:excisionase family DNA binding protein
MARGARPERKPKVSIAEAADTYNCSQRTIRRRIADGTLPAYRVGPRMIRLDPADLDKMARRIATASGSDAS